MSARVHTVAVVGAGTMGLGIAQVCATFGYNTLIYDVREEQVLLALKTIEKNLTWLVEKEKLSSEQRIEILSRIKPVFQLSAVKADIVIEAAIEKLEIKRQLFSELEKINGVGTILASNTSSISITKIAEGLKRPDNCIGLHFFNPADRMKLVEIISGAATDPRVVDAMKEFSSQIGKTAVLAKDSPGFIVNRVARHFYIESIRHLEENIAGVETIDALLRSSGFKMGPFELMDLIGVDTNLAVTKSVYEGFQQDPKFKPSRTQQQLVDRGDLGRKAGRGFYDYSIK